MTHVVYLDQLSLFGQINGVFYFVDEDIIIILFSQGRDLREDLYMDAINSVLVCGEYPHLFTNDEMDGLLQVN